MGVAPLIIMCDVLQLESQVNIHRELVKISPYTVQISDYDGLKKVKTSDVLWTELFFIMEHTCLWEIYGSSASQ